MATPADKSWNDAPPLLQIAASQQGGSRGAQVWGVTESYGLISAYQESPGGKWSSWSKPGWEKAPAAVLQIAACQQNDGRVQLWATDSKQQLWTIFQMKVGGDWSDWSGPNWISAPLFNQIAACQQGGPRGAQVWGIDDDDMLWTSFQVSPGGDWSPFTSGFLGAPPVIDVAAAQQADGTVQVWIIDEKQQVWTASQTSPGGDWTGWSGPNWNDGPTFQSLAASAQGGTVGAQLWGLDESSALWSCFNQASSGANWTNWGGPNWHNAPTSFTQLAAALQNNGCVVLFGIDDNLAVKMTAQVSPGVPNWTIWGP